MTPRIQLTIAVREHKAVGGPPSGAESAAPRREPTMVTVAFVIIIVAGIDAAGARLPNGGRTPRVPR